MKDYWN